jgi:hypothetical protein
MLSIPCRLCCRGCSQGRNVSLSSLFLDICRTDNSLLRWNVPIEIWHKIKHLRPRYIMNIAFRRGTAKQPLTWFMFCYRGSRFAYDSKWEPRKPSRKDSIGRMLDLWKNEEKDQVSSCSFGDNPDLWFLRSTDGRTEWHATLGPGCTDELHDIFLTELRRTILKQRKNGEEVPVTTLRAVTFGERGSWILYGKTELFWKDCGSLRDSSRLSKRVRSMDGSSM